MVNCRRLSLAHLMDNGTPPAALFAAPEKRWASGVVDDKAFAAGCSLHASVNLYVGALAETGRTPFNLLRRLEGRRLECLDRLTLLTIGGDGLVAVLHSLFCVAASEYDNETGDL